MFNKYKAGSKLVVSDVSIRTSNSNKTENSNLSIMKMTLELASNESINSHGINNVKGPFRLGSMITKPPKAYALQASKKFNNKSKKMVN